MTAELVKKVVALFYRDLHRLLSQVTNDTEGEILNLETWPDLHICKTDFVGKMG